MKPQNHFNSVILCLIGAGLFLLVSGIWCLVFPETRIVIRKARLGQAELIKANRFLGKQNIVLGVCFLMCSMLQMPYAVAFAWWSIGVLALYYIWHGLRHGFNPTYYSRSGKYTVTDRRTSPLRFWFEILLFALFAAFFIVSGHQHLRDGLSTKASKPEHQAELKPLQ